MDEELQQQDSGRRVTGVLSIITLVFTGIAAIPSFLSLNTPRPVVYYSDAVMKVTIPAELNPRVVRLLKANGVPTASLVVDIINQGNAKADEVAVSVTTPGPIRTLKTVPSRAEQAIWVDIPQL